MVNFGEAPSAVDTNKDDSFGRSGPGPEPQPNDPTVGGTPIQRSEEEIVKAVMETYRHEYMTRKPFEREWNRAWERIQNRYDWRKKSRWQSQKNFPAVLILALQYVWETTKSMEKAGDKWFEAESPEAEWQPLLNVVRDLIRRFIQDTAVPEDNFLSIYYEAIFWAYITGQVYIRGIAEEDGFVDMTDNDTQASVTDLYAAAGIGSAVPSFGFGSLGPEDPTAPPPAPGKKGFRLRIDTLNPRCAVKDTGGRRRVRYFMHTQALTRAEFRAEGNARGWKYIDEICDMETQFQGEYEDKERKLMEKNLMKSGARVDQVVLHHCYGVFFDSQGEWVVDEPSFFIIANRRYITSDIMPLPYWHGEIPIVMGGALMLPGNPYSKSLLGINLDAQETKVDLNNQILDYLNASINPPTEVDIDQLNNAKPNQLAGGIFPGKVFEVQKYGGVTGPAVARTGMPDMSAGVWQGYGQLKGELQEYTAIGGMSSMPRTRNRISQDEAKQRAAASTGTIEQICHNLERFVLEPLIHQLFLLLLQKLPQDEWSLFIDEQIDQYRNRTGQNPPAITTPGEPPPLGAAPPPAPSQGGRPPNTPPPPTGPVSSAAPGMPPPPPPEFENPRLVARLEAMKQLGPRERFEQLGGAFRFKVKIYSAIESRRDELEKLLQVTELAQGTPTLMARVKWHNVAERIFTLLELDPEKYLWPNEGSTADQLSRPDSAHLTAVRPPNVAEAAVTQQPLTPPLSGF